MRHIGAEIIGKAEKRLHGLGIIWRWGVPDRPSLVHAWLDPGGRQGVTQIGDGIACELAFTEVQFKVVQGEAFENQPEVGSVLRQSAGVD